MGTHRRATAGEAKYMLGELQSNPPGKKSWGGVFMVPAPPPRQFRPGEQLTPGEVADLTPDDFRAYLNHVTKG